MARSGTPWSGRQERISYRSARGGTARTHGTTELSASSGDAAQNHKLGIKTDILRSGKLLRMFL